MTYPGIARTAFVRRLAWCGVTLVSGLSLPCTLLVSYLASITPASVSIVRSSPLLYLVKVGVSVRPRPRLRLRLGVSIGVRVRAGARVGRGVARVGVRVEARAGV